MRTGVKQKLFLIFACSLLHNALSAQRTDIISAQHYLQIHYKDTLNKKTAPVLKTSFAGKQAAYDYLNTIPQFLAGKGYPVASVDSVWEIQNTIHIWLYLGTKYDWIQLRTAGIDNSILNRSGYAPKNFEGRPVNIAEIDIIKEKLLTAYENEGFPFAAVFLDSVTISENKISAILVGNKGLLYRVDSIKNYGKLKLNSRFLQQYLNISNGSTYSREKLKDVDRRMLELPYAETLQQSTLNMLGSGSILNLYVNNKKSSEASAIFGLLPDANNTGKLQVTGDLNLDLKNVFGAGEALLFKY